MEENNKLKYIDDNLKKVNNKIAESAILAGRRPEDITLIGVSKLQPPEAAAKAVMSGLNNLGENRIDELLFKKEQLSLDGLNPRWHMIGNLQRRQIKTLTGNVDLIHSVSSLKLLEEINKRSISGGVISEILIELNISEEESKHGFKATEKENILDILSSPKPGISIRGVMTMAPFTSDEIILNKVFEKTYALFSEFKTKGEKNFNILSMGMSNDYEIAIKHGATHVRIGTAIFAKPD